MATISLVSASVSLFVLFSLFNYGAIRKNKISPFATAWMDPAGVRLNELSQVEKDKYHMVFSYMWNLKTKAVSLTGHL